MWGDEVFVPRHPTLSLVSSAHLSPHAAYMQLSKLQESAPVAVVLFVPSTPSTTVSVLKRHHCAVTAATRSCVSKVPISLHTLEPILTFAHPRRITSRTTRKDLGITSGQTVIGPATPCRTGLPFRRTDLDLEMILHQ